MKLVNIADAFSDGRITSGPLAEQLIRERQGLQDEAAAWRALFRQWMNRAHHGSLTDGLNDFYQAAVALHDKQVTP